MKIRSLSSWWSGKRRNAVIGVSVILVSGSLSADFLLREPVAIGGANTGELDSATLKTDAETDRLFSKAEEFVELGRFDLASVIWQKVLDEYGDNLITRDEWKMETLDNLYRKYLTVREDLESSLPRLDPGALSGYRLSADAEAKALLAASEGSASKRVEALAEVVRRYFLSSVGDDAAYELGCLKMERYEFFPALYYFRRVLDSHPDPSVSKSELLIRIAVARAYVGDVGPAQEAIKKLEEDLGTVDPSALRAVKGLVAEVADKTSSGVVYGSGESKAQPAGILATDLSEDWVQPFKLNLGELEGLLDERPVAKAKQMSRSQLLNAWTSRALTPTGKILIHDGLLYFKNDSRIVCVSAETGDIQWLGHPNHFAFDKTSAAMGQQRHEAELFKDGVHQSMGIWGDKIFTLQGQPQDLGGGPVTTQVRSHIHRGMMTGRHRENWLAAYHRTNGLLRWYRQAKEKEGDESVEACFIGAPAFYESLMLIPMLKDGIIYLAALNPNDGKTIWLSHLCQEPMGSVKAASPVKVVVDAGEAYVATGSGVVFSLDALSGTVRWCVRYPRSGTKVNRGYSAQQANVKGWTEDDIVVSGDQLVVLACDMDYVFSLNRADGGIAWESARSPFGESLAGSYVLGKAGGKMYVGGPRVVRCYDIRGGRLLWQTELSESSYGKGTVAADGIYIPINKSIARLGLEDGKIIKQAAFTSPISEPIGNLTADGKRLFGFGLERVYAFGGLEQRFSTLTSQITSGNIGAYKTRMRLHQQVGNKKEALADLNGHFKALVENDSALEAAKIAYEGVNELQIMQESPDDALNWVLREAQATVSVPKEQMSDVLFRRNAVLNSIFTKVEKGQVVVDPKLLIDVAPFCVENYLLYGGRRAIAVVAKSAEPAVFAKALTDADARKQSVASAGLRVRAGEAAVAPLSEALKVATDDQVKLHLSTDLINLSDRSGLVALADLLESEDRGVRRAASLRLRLVSGQKFPYNANGKPEELKKGALAWKNWVVADGATAKLDLPIGEGPPYQGHTIAVQQTGRDTNLIEFDQEGKEIRRNVYTGSVYSLQKLDDGNVLVSFSNGIREYAPDGTQMWELKGVPPGQRIARRLRNGNTLVGQYSRQLTEYDPAGRVVKVWRDKMGSYSPISLTSDDTVLIMDHQKRTVEEVLPGGEVKSTLTLPHNVYWGCKGVDGTTVVVYSDQNKVTGYSPEQKELWTVPGLSYPRFVQALPDGNYAILHQRGITEVDASGKIVKQMDGRYNQFYRF